MAQTTNRLSADRAACHLWRVTRGFIIHGSQGPPSNGDFPPTEAEGPLFKAWRIPYVKSPSTHPAIFPTVECSVPTTQSLLSRFGCWVQFSKAKTLANPLVVNSARRTHKHSKCDDHRTSKLKLRKLRNILLLCRYHTSASIEGLAQLSLLIFSTVDWTVIA
jgi:hypothetical protein